jgi:hypothetical protein
MSPFSREQLNALAIKKQCLDGADIGVTDMVWRIYGLHATSPATPYLSLFARLKNFNIKDLDEELYIKRTMGRIRCVRRTIYIFPVEFMPIAFAATKRVMGLNSLNHCKYMGVSERDYDELSKRALELLKAHPMTTLQVRKALGTGLHVSSVLNVMCDEGLLARGKPAGWRSNQYTYYSFEDYYPGLRLDSVPEREAIAELVRRYLGAFGPVTENDIAWWTGLNKKDVREALEGLGEDVAAEGNMAMLRPDLDALIKTKKPRGRVVNLLPYLDPYLMGYKERDRYLDKEFNGYVFDWGGNATSTIVVDGRVAGVWDLDGPLVKLFFFREAGKDVVALVKAKARAMGYFVTGRECGVATCDSMTPLAHRTAGAVMSPLKDRSDL